MKMAEAIAILEKPREEAVAIILDLARRAERNDQLYDEISPNTPSGQRPVYLKPNHRQRKKKPGRKKGHPGFARRRPDKIDHFKEHTLDNCPYCQAALEQKPIAGYTRYTEDIPPVEPEVTEHKINGYWCPDCKKIVYARVTDALPNAVIGRRIVILTAWLHYLIGVSVGNLVKMLSVFTNFKITPGGLTQAWKNLAAILESNYQDIGRKIAQGKGALNADETGWRVNGITHWLWCFTTPQYCYYVIDKCRGSPVARSVLGAFFPGILICDFWGAYNKIEAIAKQRCFYHLFTELIKVDKRNRSPEWMAFRKKLSRLLKDAIRLSDKRNQLDTQNYNRLKDRLYLRLDRFLAIPYNDQDARRLIKRLKRHRNELFTFLEYEEVSPYNNHAEQQMRKPVLTRRISQQNRSNHGARTQAILMTLFRSAELQGVNPVEEVLRAAENAIAVKSSLSWLKKAV